MTSSSVTDIITSSVSNQHNMCSVVNKMSNGKFPYLFSVQYEKICWLKCVYNKEMSWFRNTITDLYNAVSAPVAATRDPLAARLESVRETATLLYERAKQKLGYGQPLKDIVEEQANQDYIGIEDIKHLYPRAKTQTTDNGIQGMRYLFDEHDM